MLENVDTGKRSCTELSEDRLSAFSSAAGVISRGERMGTSSLLLKSYRNALTVFPLLIPIV